MPPIKADEITKILKEQIANFGSDYLDSYIIQKTTLDIRGQLNETLQNQSLSFFNRTPTAS